MIKREVVQSAESLEETRPQERKHKSQKHARVTVFANWCKDCGLCVAFCPHQVFEANEDGHPIVVHPERCTGCQWCTMHCPDFAIVVSVDEGSGAERRERGEEAE